MKILLANLVFVSLLFAQNKLSSGNNNYELVWRSDNEDGTYSNPIIYADYSDPDVIKIGDDYYMVSSSFNCTPALPILHSKDLVNWKIINHVAQNLPSPIFDKPQHGKGVWAPSIRFYKGEVYVYYGDPDLGIFMSKTKNPADKWEPLHLIKSAKGWIDPCPLWDDDGKAYLVHAWAKSRAGFNSILTVRRMSGDGKNILDDSVNVFDGTKNHPTIEGPKFYKRDKYYYIFAPAGGVKPGWQTVLRSKNIFGPYEDKIVLEQGTTKINGPHQGAWVSTQTGEDWFIHFQDKDAYGRIVHLQPMIWKNDWPVMGIDKDGDGKGEPVLTWKKPNVGKNYPIEVPQTNDEFDSTSLGLQWQWHANHSDHWYSLTEKKGILRLYSVSEPQGFKNFWDIPNLLLQKFPAPKFSVTTKLDFNPASIGELSGLIVMGFDYSYLAFEKKSDGIYLVKNSCKDADKETPEIEEASVRLSNSAVFLRVTVNTGGACNFSYSEDGVKYHTIGKSLIAREGRWIGAKIGLFALSKKNISPSGYSDFDWFRIEKLY